jgi:hypothetical protein
VKTITPYLRNGYSLRVSGQMLDLFRKEEDQLSLVGWVIQYRGNGSFSVLDQWISLCSKEDLSFIPESALQDLLVKLRTYGYAKTALAMLCDATEIQDNAGK